MSPKKRRRPKKTNVIPEYTATLGEEKFNKAWSIMMECSGDHFENRRGSKGKRRRGHRVRRDCANVINGERRNLQPKIFYKKNIE